MKKKGFTLIELLAVIVILAIIALIAVPVIMNIISSARKSAFEDAAYGIIKAGELYYAEQLLNDGMEENATFTFNKGKVDPTDLKVQGSLPDSGSMIVTTDGKVAIAISNRTYCVTKGYDESKIKIDKDDGNCKIPEEQTVKTLKDIATTTPEVVSVATCATDGTICAPGTKFAIKVNDGETYNFYVVSDTDNTVTLIMDRNIGETTAWLDNSDFINAGGIITDEMLNDGGACQYGNICLNNNKGPITALSYLEKQTSGWTNIEAKDYTVADENNPKIYSDILRTGARARMLTITEATAVGCTEYYSGSSATCPTWLYGNLAQPPYGFWLSSASADVPDRAWFVSYDGIVDYVYVFNDDSSGARPVIEISK